MNVGAWLTEAQRTLADAGIETARLDCLVLLEDELSSSRAHLLAHPETELTARQLHTLHTKIAQRATHLPLAYIRGKAYFYGREFTVNKHTLVPRPESEAMLDLLKSLPLPHSPHILDIGTGSGCLGISAALELPASRVTLCDIDPPALAVARRNARQHGVQVQCRRQDLLGQKSASADVILANLPYVPEHMHINQAAGFEPAHALFAGPDGLDLYKQFWQQAAASANNLRFIITESLPSQHHAVANLARTAGFYLAKTEGLAQLFEKM